MEFTRAQEIGDKRRKSVMSDEGENEQSKNVKNDFDLFQQIFFYNVFYLVSATFVSYLTIDIRNLLKK